MEKILITKAMLDEHNNYIGDIDVSNAQLWIELEWNLWCVKFKSIGTTKYVYAQAGTWIEAGEWIKAGWWIVAGLYIKCKQLLKFKLRLFAGVCRRREITDTDMVVECWKLDGKVVHWIVKELGMQDELRMAGKSVTVTIDWKEYVAIIQQ